MIDCLKPISDLERLANRVVAGVAGPRELLALRISLEGIPALRRAIEGHTPLAYLLNQLDPCRDVVEMISRAISDASPAVLGVAGIVKPGYSADLDHIEEATREAKTWVNSLEAVERERTGIKSLKVGFNKVFGYYIEVSNSNTGKVPDDYIGKQTLVNAERYITPLLKTYEEQILSAEEQVIELETMLFHGVVRRDCGLCPSLIRDGARRRRTGRLRGAGRSRCP